MMMLKGSKIFQWLLKSWGIDFQEKINEPGMVAHVCNPNTQEAEVRGS
jgi:hypothetical protein